MSLALSYRAITDVSISLSNVLPGGRIAKSGPGAVKDGLLGSWSLSLKNQSIFGLDSYFPAARSSTLRANVTPYQAFPISLSRIRVLSVRFVYFMRNLSQTENTSASPKQYRWLMSSGTALRGWSSVPAVVGAHTMHTIVRRPDMLARSLTELSLSLRKCSRQREPYQSSETRTREVHDFVKSKRTRAVVPNHPRHTPLYICRGFLQYLRGLPTSHGTPCPKV